MLGRPDSEAGCNRNRSPAAYRARRTANSGAVSLHRIHAMIRERRGQYARAFSGQVSGTSVTLVC